MQRPRWICCQQGARDHYAVPRAVFANQNLLQLVTDEWLPHGLILNSLPELATRRLRGRFHADLAVAQVAKANLRFAWCDLVQLVRPIESHKHWTYRNALFDGMASKAVANAVRKCLLPAQQLIVFANSYACRDTFRAAKDLGLQTVLYQFDPGPVECDIMDGEMKACTEFRVADERYPDSYFARWREEVLLADRILVASAWTSKCLERAGIAPDRVRIVPLVYQPARIVHEPHVYPERFDSDRPLRVLFLGQVILRKGIARLLKSADQLLGLPVEFRLVGPTNILNLAQLLVDRRNVHWYGAVPRDMVSNHYREADVFILPTLSDAFALTQLESLFWRVPIIVTRECGDVVKDGVNGILLPDATSESITNVIRRLLFEPTLLRELSEGTEIDSYSIDRLSRDLSGLEYELGS